MRVDQGNFLLHTSIVVRIVLAVALVSMSCTHAQAPAARRVGEVLAIGGVLGLIAAVVTTRVTGLGTEPVTAFSVVSAVGIVTYAAGELSDPVRARAPETESHKLRRWAKILTERAAGAARDGRCPRVRRYEKRVQLYDPVIHDLVFMRDPEILRCLADPQPTASPTEVPAS